MKGKQRSKDCSHCGHHPTKRVYIKKSGIFRGIAWFCTECGEFTLDMS